MALMAVQGELKRRKQAETVAYISDFIADREARRAAERAADFAEERKIQVRHCKVAAHHGSCKTLTQGMSGSQLCCATAMFHAVYVSVMVGHPADLVDSGQSQPFCRSTCKR